jgi:hypothetical protein
MDLTENNCLLEATRIYEFVMCEILGNKEVDILSLWIDRLQRINIISSRGGGFGFLICVDLFLVSVASGGFYSV